MRAVQLFSVGRHCTQAHIAQLWHDWQPQMNPQVSLWLVDLSELQQIDTAGVLLINALAAQAEFHQCELCFKAPLDMALPDWALVLLNRSLWRDDAPAAA